MGQLRDYLWILLAIRGRRLASVVQVLLLLVVVLLLRGHLLRIVFLLPALIRCDRSAVLAELLILLWLLW